jgi:predicted O-methyltransferase YrrM
LQQSLSLNFFRARAYINHWLEVVDEHSIHSPFFFDFYEKVIKPKNYRGQPELESIRANLLASTAQIEMMDLGAVSPHFQNHNRPLSKIAATSASPKSLCELLQRIVTHIQATRIIELGTSVGLTTLYLALNPESKVFTFEGNKALVQVALTHSEYFNKKNISIITGNIDQTLPDFIQNPAKIDFALMDANHRYAPTMKYFELLAKRVQTKGVIVVDDIYYSPEMAKAWNELKQHPLVYGSVDLFRCGLLFFDPALNRQHYVWSV